MERGCSTNTSRIVIRGAGGREFALRTYNPVCHEEPTAAWSADGAQLIFVDNISSPKVDNVLDCSLAVASSRHASSPSAFRFVAPDTGCYFRSAAFDTDGIAAIEICGPAQTGGLTRLLQLNHHRQVTERLDLAPGQPGVLYDDEDVNVVNDPLANTVLVSQVLYAAHPESTRIWTFDGTHLLLIRRFNTPLVAEP